jgi:hypothetical protein
VISRPTYQVYGILLPLLFLDVSSTFGTSQTLLEDELQRQKKIQDRLDKEDGHKEKDIYKTGATMMVSTTLGG